MFEKLRQTLVDSYVGAIGLGYLLAQGILSFVDIFSSPAAGWLMRHELCCLNVSYPGLPTVTLEPGKPLVLKYHVT